MDLKNSKGLLLPMNPGLLLPQIMGLRCLSFVAIDQISKSSVWSKGLSNDTMTIHWIFTAICRPAKDPCRIRDLQEFGTELSGRFPKNHENGAP